MVKKECEVMWKVKEILRNFLMVCPKLVTEELEDG